MIQWLQVDFEEYIIITCNGVNWNSRKALTIPCAFVDFFSLGFHYRPSFSISPPPLSCSIYTNKKSSFPISQQKSEICTHREMEGLKRSDVSFRRQGSSGLVFDDRFLSGELNRMNREDQTKHEDDGVDDAKSKPINTSAGYRAGKVAAAQEPPSPRVSACGFCVAFRKQSSAADHRNRKTAKVRRRTAR